MTTTRILMTVSQAWTDKCDKSGDCNDKYTRAVPATLSSAVASVATKELRETSATREQALLHLRTWLAQNTDVKNVRLDETFLLRFLRLKKYSLPMAQQTLLKYLNLRRYYPELSAGLDCEDVKLKSIIDSGYIMVSPVRDSHGRKVIIYDMSAFEVHKYSCWDMARSHLLLYESLLEEVENQVLGFTHVGSGAGVTAAYVTAWNPIHFARLMKWGEQSIPMRHKEVHLINIPASIKYVLDFACSKMSPKMTERLNIHTNLKGLHNKVDIACLPCKYGGAVPTEDMIHYTKQILATHRAKVLGLGLMQLTSTRGIQSSRPSAANVMEGSFRQLQID